MKYKHPISHLLIHSGGLTNRASSILLTTGHESEHEIIDLYSIQGVDTL